MIYIGYLIYAIVIAAICLIPSVTDIIITSYNLATEITVGCGVLGMYPPLLFLYYQLRGFNDKDHEDTFNAISAMCNATVVSLGLIGTFIGLTQMIEKIAGAIGGSSGQSMEQQIAGVMAAISASLNSMSFAFLTSVMGVSAAVIIAGACTYFREFFKDGSSLPTDVSIDDDALSRLEADNSKIKQIINRVVGSNIDRSELGSIVVSNSLQVKELSKITARLADQCELKAQVERDLTDVLIRMDSRLENVEKLLSMGCENQVSAFKELTMIKDACVSASDGVLEMREHQEKVREVLRQI